MAMTTACQCSPLTVSNGAPVISDLFISPDPATTNDSLTANVVVTDPEGDPVTLAMPGRSTG